MVFPVLRALCVCHWNTPPNHNDTQHTIRCNKDINTVNAYRVYANINFKISNVWDATMDYSEMVGTGNMCKGS